MKKKLIVINGTMGVGKTTVSKHLYHSLDRVVWLDGDWCWMMNPWVVNEETTQMVENNIAYLLKNYLSNQAFDTVLFSWVLHRQEIANRLLEKLADLEFELERITLMCSEAELRRRMVRDNRTQEQISRSIERLRLYNDMPTIHMDTTELNVTEIAERIKNIVEEPRRDHYDKL